MSVTIERKRHELLLSIAARSNALDKLIQQARMIDGCPPALITLAEEINKKCERLYGAITSNNMARTVQLTAEINKADTELAAMLKAWQPDLPDDLLPPSLRTTTITDGQHHTKGLIER